MACLGYDFPVDSRANSGDLLGKEELKMESCEVSGGEMIKRG